MSQHRSMYMPAPTSSPYSTIPKLKKEGFEVPPSRSLSRQDGRSAPGQAARADDASRHTFDGRTVVDGQQLSTDDWSLEGNGRSSASSSSFAHLHKYTLPYPSVGSFPAASFAAASAAEIDDALSSLVGSFPSGRLAFDNPVGHGSAFSYPQQSVEHLPAPYSSLNPQSLTMPSNSQPLHTPNVNLGGRTSANNSPHFGHAHPPASSYGSLHSASLSNSLFDSYKAVTSSSDFTSSTIGGHQRGRSGPFSGLSYSESLASPATSVSISSCHPSASGVGAAGNNGSSVAAGGSSLRSRSRSSIRDHREATSGLGGRSRSAVRRGSFTAADVDRILSPATEGQVAASATSTANANGNGGPSRSNSAAPHRRAASIIIPSAGSASVLSFNASGGGSSLPAFTSTAQRQNSAAAAAPWVYSPPGDKGELPLVREGDSGDEGLVEMNRVDDPKNDTLAEKRRRRRESHNAVERRRRDTINEKISELSTLLPACMLDPVRTLPYSAQELAADLCALAVDLSFASTVPTADDALDDDDEPMMVSVEDEAKSGKAGAGKGKGKKVGPKKKTGGGGGLNAIGPDGKPNKGIVLKKSVEYIRHLHQIIQAQAARNADLESMLQSALQIQSPPSSVSQPSVSASDASASPSNGYVPSQTSYASLARPILAPEPPALKHESTSSFPSLHEMLADAEESKQFNGFVSADTNMADGPSEGSNAATSSIPFLADGSASAAGTSSISSPHLFPWSANPGSPSNDTEGLRPGSSGMLDPDTPSTPSRRDSGEEDEAEERGRGRQTRFLSGGGNLIGGEGWGQDVGGVDGAFRGFDDRGHFGASFDSGGTRSHSRRDDVIME